MEAPGLREDGSFDMPVTEEHIGAGLLDSISSGMYPNVYDILREYIQNAIDAHAAWVRISVTKHEVTILDNGDGMGLAELDNARKVGVSGKPGTGKVGFRGIGVYSSFAVCDQVEVVSRPKSGGGIFRLQFDHAGVRAETERVSGGRRNTPPLSATLDRHTRIFPADEKSVPKEAGDGAFTYIRLIRPTQHFRARLNDEEKVRTYLTSSVPLNFPEAGFEHAEEVRGTLENWVPTLNLIRIHYRFGNGQEDTFTQPRVSNVLRPVFRVVQTKSGVTVGFIWACVSRSRNQVEPDEARGFQMRFRGFGINNRRFPKVFWPSRGGGQLYEWVTGEIYVLDETLVPTVDRANFEEGESRDRLYDLLKKVFDEFEKVVGRRREALRNIERGAEDLGPPGKLSKGRKDVQKGLTTLERLRSDFASKPELTTTELLDEEGRKILTKLGILHLVDDPSQIDFTRISTEAAPGEDAGTDDTDGSDAGGGGADTGGSGDGSGAGSDDDDGGESGGGGDDGGGGTGTGGGGGEDGTSTDDEPEPPPIVETLRPLLDWPLGAEDVFRELEGALRSTFDERDFRRARRAVYERFNTSEDILDDRE
jgi:uncharacterized membrane protein YgcG